MKLCSAFGFIHGGIYCNMILASSTGASSSTQWPVMPSACAAVVEGEAACLLRVPRVRTRRTGEDQAHVSESHKHLPDLIELRQQGRRKNYDYLIESLVNRDQTA